MTDKRTIASTTFGHVWRWRWIMTAMLILIPAMAFAWWGRSTYPESFPPLIEELDRQAWASGAQTLFPDRYAQFHQNINKLRTRWRMETNRWWHEDSAEEFNQQYQELMKEGSLLIEASRQKSTAVRHEIKELIVPEHEQLTRLRSLANLFDMAKGMSDLSRAEGLLKESALRLEHGQYAHARLAGKRALEYLDRVETHTMAQMERYNRPSQLTQWEQYVNYTIRWSKVTGGTAVVVLKAPRRLYVYQRGRIVADYPVQLGFSGLVDKLYEGDGATPEGQFHILRKKEGSETKYYKALLIDYPTNASRQRFDDARNNGLIPSNRSIGSFIEIHGENPTREDATSGCIALENSAMDQVFERVTIGTPITIVGGLNPDNVVVETLHQIERHRQQRLARWEKKGSLESSLTIRNK